MKTIKLTTLGLSGPEWIKHLEKKRYRISDWAKQVLNNPEYEKHRLKKGQKIEVALVSVKDMGKEYATAQEIQDYAASKGYEVPSAEVALLIREAVSDKQMEEMGFYYVVALHDPIEDSGGDPDVLGAYRLDGGRWVSAYWGSPGGGWYDFGASAFLVSASKSSDTQSLPSVPLPLDSAIKIVKDAGYQVSKII